MNLVRQSPEDIEGCTWIGTDLKLLIGVGHSIYVSDLKMKGQFKLYLFYNLLKGVTGYVR